MSTRFTFPLLIIFAIIAIAFCEIKVTVDNYKKDWRCHHLCSAYNMGPPYTFLPDEACSTLNGTPGGCPKKLIELYKKSSSGNLTGFFEEHSLLKCVSDGAIVGYLTLGREVNEYLEWYESNDGKFYPLEFVNYTPPPPED